MKMMHHRKNETPHNTKNLHFRHVHDHDSVNSLGPGRTRGDQGDQGGPGGTRGDQGGPGGEPKS